MTSKYLKPPVRGSRCKKSNPINSMGKEDGMVLRGVCGRVFGDLSLMHLQILVTRYLTASYILGQNIISFTGRSYPTCTMSTSNSLNTNDFSLLGNIT